MPWTTRLCLLCFWGWPSLWGLYDSCIFALCLSFGAWLLCESISNGKAHLYHEEESKINVLLVSVTLFIQLCFAIPKTRKYWTGSWVYQAWSWTSNYHHLSATISVMTLILIEITLLPDLSTFHTDVANLCSWKLLLWERKSVNSSCMWKNWIPHLLAFSNSLCSSVVAFWSFYLISYPTMGFWLCQGCSPLNGSWQVRLLNPAYHFGKWSLFCKCKRVPVIAPSICPCSLWNKWYGIADSRLFSGRKPVVQKCLMNWRVRVKSF